LVLDEPTGLPEGAEVELLPLDPGDWLDDTERAALHQALRESDVDVAQNRLTTNPRHRQFVQEVRLARVGGSSELQPRRTPVSKHRR
jgi:hypothetical protein